MFLVQHRCCLQRRARCLSSSCRFGRGARLKSPSGGRCKRRTLRLPFATQKSSTFWWACEVAPLWPPITFLFPHSIGLPFMFLCVAFHTYTFIMAGIAVEAWITNNMYALVWTWRLTSRVIARPPAVAVRSVPFPPRPRRGAAPELGRPQLHRWRMRGCV